MNSGVGLGAAHERLFDRAARHIAQAAPALVRRAAGWLRRSTGVGLLLASSLACAEIVVVESDASAPYADARAALVDALPGLTLRPRGLAELPDAVRRPDVEAVVTLGADALRAVLAAGGSAPVVATLLPRSAWDPIRDGYRAGGGRRPITAVWLDQPPARQIALVRAVLPGAKRLAVLATEESSGLANDLRRAAAPRGFALAIEEVAAPQDLQPVLRATLPGVEALLAVPDARIYNGATLQQILLDTFRMRRPVFAFSPGYVRAGALAAVHSTPAQLAQQSAGLVRRVLAGQPLPAPQFPQRFVVTVNRAVARALDLAPDTDEALAARLEPRADPDVDR